MKKIILSIALFTLASTLTAMNKPIVLPSQEELNSRLCLQGLNHFVRETKIDEKLGGKTLRPVNIVKVINSTLDDYSKELGNTTVSQMNMHRPVIMDAFFEEHPGMVTSLEEMGWLEARSRY
jgi:hypothetical protein